MGPQEVEDEGRWEALADERGEEAPADRRIEGRALPSEPRREGGLGEGPLTLRAKGRCDGLAREQRIEAHPLEFPDGAEASPTFDQDQGPRAGRRGARVVDRA